MFIANVFMLEIYKIFLSILSWKKICLLQENEFYLEYFSLFALRNHCDENF